MAGRMPPARMPSRGKPVKNSAEMAGAPRARIYTMTPMMGITSTAAINVIRLKPSRSATWRSSEKRRLMSGQDSLGSLAGAEDHRRGRDIDRQRDDEQHHPDEEQHVIVH